MKATILASLGALASLASAQTYNISSKPFHLVLKSDNDTLECTSLVPCHEGAAIEGLCLGDKNLTDASIFTFNTSYYSEPTNSSIGDQGILSWILPTADLDVPSGLTLQTNPTTNVGMPLFYPGDDEVQLIAFDDMDLLNIQGYIDDTVIPINTTAGPKAYYRWYICDTYFGYAYTTLAWVCIFLFAPSAFRLEKRN